MNTVREGNYPKRHDPGRELHKKFHRSVGKSAGRDRPRRIGELGHRSPEAWRERGRERGERVAADASKYAKLAIPITTKQAIIA